MFSSKVSLALLSLTTTSTFVLHSSFSLVRKCLSLEAHVVYGGDGVIVEPCVARVSCSLFRLIGWMVWVHGGIVFYLLWSIKEASYCTWHHCLFGHGLGVIAAPPALGLRLVRSTSSSPISTLHYHYNCFILILWARSNLRILFVAELDSMAYVFFKVMPVLRCIEEIFAQSFVQYVWTYGCYVPIHDIFMIISC